MTPAVSDQRLKWWGWGRADRRLPLPDGALAMLRSELGELDPDPRVELDQVSLPPARPLPAAVVDAAGDALVTGVEDRIRHAAGRSYPDLVRLRSGRLDAAPDGVALPADAAGVRALVDACSASDVAVVPFGGGTSVVGGVDPIADGFDAVLALDLARLRDVGVDSRSLTATLGAGLRGPEAELMLARSGVTLGHCPQSFECATIGGFAATRSAGQASSGYGRFDAMVAGVRLAAPAGDLATLRTPHSAAGPALRELVVGSEGTLGAITEVTVRVRPLPELRRYEAWMTADWTGGTELVRSLAQDGSLPDVVRLSDAEETRISLASGGPAGLAGRAFAAYLRARRVTGGCLLICGWEGAAEAVRRRRAVAARVLRAGGAVPLGTRAGRSWERGRYDGPYLRDELLDAGVMVETLETAHSWSRLHELYGGVVDAISSALRAQGTPGIVYCHLSHAYPDGASLYFTFMARRRPGEEIEQWRRVKSAACEAIVAAEGTITHHHAVGRDHAPYMEAEVGRLGLEVLAAAKERLDPAGIMNPGKLLGADRRR
jgi:alkyldihydroxyacetonephosphate synthase